MSDIYVLTNVVELEISEPELYYNKETAFKNMLHQFCEVICQQYNNAQREELIIADSPSDLESELIKRFEENPDYVYNIDQCDISISYDSAYIVGSLNVVWSISKIGAIK